MKRSIIAAAFLATLGTSAFAQSSVTMYGRLNLTLENRKVGDVKEKGLYNNASRIGMKGTEDLGGGLKAGFQIEHGFAADTGSAASTFWGRQSEVNLSGGFGMVRLGNFTSEAYFATADYISFHNHDTGSSSDAFYADTRGFRQSDKIAYRTPAFGNFTLEAAINMRDTVADPERTVELAMNYGSGPLSIGAGFQKTGDARQFAVRGMYEIGAVTLGGYVQRDTDVYAAGDRTTLRLSGMYTMGNTELHANVGRAGDYSGVAGDSAASQITFGVNQNLSKRTKVYGYLTKVSDKGTIYGDFQSLAVGVRHNF